MPRPSFDLSAAGLPPVLEPAAFLRLRVRGVRFRDRCAEVILTVTGYLRPRPDPAAVAALRTAFAELDSELAAILGDRRSPTAIDR